MHCVSCVPLSWQPTASNPCLRTSRPHCLYLLCLVSLCFRAHFSLVSNSFLSSTMFSICSLAEWFRDMLILFHLHYDIRQWVYICLRRSPLTWYVHWITQTWSGCPPELRRRPRGGCWSTCWEISATDACCVITRQASLTASIDAVLISGSWESANMAQRQHGAIDRIFHEDPSESTIDIVTPPWNTCRAVIMVYNNYQCYWMFLSRKKTNRIVTAFG